MSDFDTVLERLVVDPAFRAALGADPAGVLAGYRLSPDEIELLHAQVDTGSGGNRQVEQRTSKASLFGLLSPLAGAVGLAGDDLGTGDIGKAVGFGSHAGSGGFGPAGHGVGEAVGGVPGGAGDAGFGAESAGLGPAAGAGFGAESAGLGPAAGAGFGAESAGLGPAAGGGFGIAGAPGGAGLADSDPGGLAGQIGRPIDQPDGGLLGHHLAGVQPGGQSGVSAAPPPPDYHPHIDVDGDGHWDRYTVQRRADGGVDVLADMNRDGRADFVGHDVDRDGLIDAADYDEDRDGRFETHMRDVTGDGWLDTRTVDPSPAQDGTSGVGRHRAPGGEGFGAAR
jgi:hypothetical protein